MTHWPTEKKKNPTPLLCGGGGLSSESCSPARTRPDTGVEPFIISRTQTPALFPCWTALFAHSRPDVSTWTGHSRLPRLAQLFLCPLHFNAARPASSVAKASCGGNRWERNSWNRLDLNKKMKCCRTNVATTSRYLVLGAKTVHGVLLYCKYGVCVSLTDLKTLLLN